MAKRWKRLIWLVGTVSAILTVLTWGHCFGFDPWNRVEADVTENGRPIAAKVFKSSEGYFAIVFPVTGESRQSPYLGTGYPERNHPVYTFDPGRLRELTAGGSHFAIRFSRLWLKPGAARGLDLHPDSVKLNMNPRVFFSNGILKFTTVEGDDIVVKFRAK